MSERKIMKNFLYYMQKEHKYHFKWLLFWVCGVIILLLNGGVSNNNAETVTDLHFIVSGILLAMGSIVYFRKYTELAPTTRIKGADSDPRTVVILMFTELSGIIRSHGFDVGAYFGLLIEKFMVVQGISIAAVLIAGAFKVIEMSNVFFYGGMILIIPLVIWSWEMVIMDFARTHKTGVGFAFIMMVWYFIETIVAIIVLAYSFISFIILISGLVYSNALLKGVDMQAVVKYTYNDWATIWVIILAVILTIFFADVNQLIIRIQWTKTKRLIVAGIILAIAALIIVQGISCKKNNIALSENSISVKHDSSEKTYKFDEIGAYNIYYKYSELKMNVTFSDGKNEEIFDDSTETDGWDERYHSDFGYASDLVDYLIGKGVKGTIDMNGFSNDAWQRDSLDKAYLEHIVKALAD